MFGGRKKRTIDDSERSVPDRDRARERTMNRAVRLLAARQRSVAELRTRLLEKPWTDAVIVDAVIAKLTEYKYLNDEQYAADLAHSKLRQRPQGRRRLEQAMSTQKLDRATVESAIDSAFETLPEAELIDNAIRKRLRLKGKPETRDDLQKFFAYLARLGFGFDLIREKMAAVADDRLVED